MSPARPSRRTRIAAFAVGASCAALLAACSTSPSTPASTNGSPTPSPTASPTAPLPLTVTSEDFVDGGNLGPTFGGCGGHALNPQVSWSEGPAGTVTYALAMTDPDASNYSHWLQYDIPASVTSVAQGAANDFPGTRGRNSNGVRGYLSPCPPSGVHHYVITVYALDTALNPADTIIWAEFKRDSTGHILAQGQIVGLYPPAG